MARITARRPVATDKRFRPKIAGGDHGTTERWQHTARLLEPTDRAGIWASRAAEEHALDSLVLCGLLDRLLADAGLRLKEDFHMADLGAHLTGGYSGQPRATGAYCEHERSDAEEAAYGRWRKAVMAMGARDGALVLAVVCYDAPPVAKDLYLLRQGLTRLAAWYGMKKPVS